VDFDVVVEFADLPIDETSSRASGRKAILDPCGDKIPSFRMLLSSMLLNAGTQVAIMPKHISRKLHISKGAVTHEKS
jgi:hypothetical protein